MVQVFIPSMYLSKSRISNITLLHKRTGVTGKGFLVERHTLLYIVLGLMPRYVAVSSIVQSLFETLIRSLLSIYSPLFIRKRSFIFILTIYRIKYILNNINNQFLFSRSLLCRSSPNAPHAPDAKAPETKGAVVAVPISTKPNVPAAYATGSSTDYPTASSRENSLAGRYARLVTQTASAEHRSGRIAYLTSDPIPK